MVFRAFCLLSLFALSPGCSSDPGPVAKDEPAVPASGIVTYKGKPLPQHQVVVTPTDGRRPATGVTDAEGKFVLGTNAPGDGAPSGTAKVSIAWAGPEISGDPADQGPVDDPSLMPKPPVAIPAKYSNPETSGLTADIPASGTDALKFDLQ